MAAEDRVAWLEADGRRLHVGLVGGPGGEVAPSVVAAPRGAPWVALLPVLGERGERRGVAALRDDGLVWEVGRKAPPEVRPKRHDALPAPVRSGFVQTFGGTSLAVLLAGGQAHRSDGRLRGARVVVADVEGGWVRRAREGLDPSLQPWLLRSGRRRDECLVFVGVCRRTRFDPALRPRPFIYRLEAGAAPLRPVWLGSFLARPFEDVVWVDLTGDGADELVALERTAEGRSALTAYAWRSFGLEPLASTERVGCALPQLAAGRAGGRPVVCLALRRGDGVRYEAYRLDGDRLVGVAGSATLPCRPAGWTMAGAVLEVDAEGELKTVALLPL